MSPIFCASNYTAGDGKTVNIIQLRAKNSCFLQMVLLLQHLTHSMSQHLNKLRLMFNAAAPRVLLGYCKIGFRDYFAQIIYHMLEKVRTPLFLFIVLVPSLHNIKNQLYYYSWLHLATCFGHYPAIKE